MTKWTAKLKTYLRGQILGNVVDDGSNPTPLQHNATMTLIIFLPFYLCT